MKCPKCGYNSFEYLDQCKKCGSDLVQFKQNNGIRSVLVPVVAQEVSVPEVATPAVVPAPELPQDQPVEQGGGGEFTWDEPAAEQAGALPDFSFSEVPAEAEANLGDLLETTAPLERTVAAAGGTDERSNAPGTSRAAGVDATPGEFELGDFLSEGKEPSQAEPAPPRTTPPAELDGDFDFLFNSDEEKK